MKQPPLIPDLYGEPPGTGNSEQLLHDYMDVKGLCFMEAFLDVEEQQNLLAQIDKQPWLHDLSRRVQHYGYKYDYRARRVDKSMKIGALPAFGKDIAKKLVARGLMQTEADQLIVNEYQPGQGIADHIDCEPCFGDEIATVSLGWKYEMRLTYEIEHARKQIIAIPLPQGSCLVFAEDARWKWKHGIASRKSDPDLHGGKAVERKRRVSLTFRTVKIE